MPTEKEVRDMIETMGGKVNEIGGPLPDGSGFAVASFPLPKDHWIYTEEDNVPPTMPLRVGLDGTMVINTDLLERPTIRLTRQQAADMIREVGKYAIRGVHHER